MFEGVAIMKLRDGKIAEYHEVANTATGFVDMNFAPERIAKIVGQAGRGVEGAAGDEAASGVNSIVALRRRLGLAIGLRCARAATVEVPIGPCSS